MRWDVVGTAVLVLAVFLLYKRGGFGIFGKSRITDWLVFLLAAGALFALLRV
jgi:hypothetical protein